MFIRDLFEDFELAEPAPGQVMPELQQAATNMIVPLINQRVPFMTMQQAIQGLSSTEQGITISRQMIIDIFSPEKIKAIKKVEGDRIWFQYPDDEHSDEQKTQGKDKVADMAAAEINKNLKGKAK
jgi:hypothetical protein